MSQKQNQINIELSDEISKGKYSNLAMIAHSSSEFVIDFIQLMPGVPKAKVNSRIILTPQHAKRLMKALVDNINKFEGQNGEIKDISENLCLNFVNGKSIISHSLLEIKVAEKKYLWELLVF